MLAVVGLIPGAAIGLFAPVVVLTVLSADGAVSYERVLLPWLFTLPLGAAAGGYGLWRLGGRAARDGASTHQL